MDKKVVNRAVAIGVAPRSGANEVEMARLVKKEIGTIRKILPPGTFIDVASDNTVYIESSIKEVKFQLLIGGIAAALVVLFFLQNIRTTVFTSIAIPTSIISTFAAIYAFGFTINNLTMLALVTAVGLVIDDSIIMEENIYRHRFELNKPARQAALEGSREIGFAVIEDDVLEIAPAASLLRRLPLTVPRMFTSSRLGDHNVEGPRRQLFERTVTQAEEAELPKRQDRFHAHLARQAGGERPHVTR